MDLHKRLGIRRLKFLPHLKTKVKFRFFEVGESFQKNVEYKKYYNKKIKKIKEKSDLLGEVLYVDVYDGKIIANIFGQEDIRKGPGDETVYTVEDALIKGLKDVRDKAYKLNLSVAIPTYIGCGMANGDWNSIKPKIDELFEYSGVDVTFYHYKP